MPRRSCKRPLATEITHALTQSRTPTSDCTHAITQSRTRTSAFTHAITPSHLGSPSRNHALALRMARGKFQVSSLDARCATSARRRSWKSAERKEHASTASRFSCAARNRRRSVRSLCCVVSPRWAAKRSNCRRVKLLFLPSRERASSSPEDVSLAHRAPPVFARPGPVRRRTGPGRR